MNEYRKKAKYMNYNYQFFINKLYVYIVNNMFYQNFIDSLDNDLSQLHEKSFRILFYFSILLINK